MNISDELLFFFSALGVFNALLISFYFFFIKKPKIISNFFLGLLLLMMAIRVGKSVFYYFNDDLDLFFIKFGLAACVLIGPALYFYVKSCVRPDSKVRFWQLHFLVLLALSIIVGISFPETHDPYIIGNLSWVSLIYWIWLGYIIASGWVIRSTITKIFDKNEKLSDFDFWVLSVFIGNLIIWVAYKTCSYTSYIVGALSFSFIFYLLFLLIHFRRKKGAIFSKSHKYSNKKIEVVEAKELSIQLNHLMEKEKMYTNADLKLSDVANRMNILPHTLSQLINDNLGKSFTLLVNEYRVQEAKNLIQSKTHLKLEAVGYDCGFNSKSTFYSVFKKLADTTPAKYKESLS